MITRFGFGKIKTWNLALLVLEGGLRWKMGTCHLDKLDVIKTSFQGCWWELYGVDSALKALVLFDYQYLAAMDGHAVH